MAHPFWCKLAQNRCHVSRNAVFNSLCRYSPLYPLLLHVWAYTYAYVQNRAKASMKLCKRGLLCALQIVGESAPMHLHNWREIISEGVPELPYPISMLSLLLWYQFWWQIIFKREEARLSSSLLNKICRQIWYQSKSDYMDKVFFFGWAVSVQSKTA